MNLRLEAQISQLKAKGIPLDALTADELAALVEACNRCDKPFTFVNTEAVGIPVKVCEGVYLWRLTIGASVWLDEFASVWWGKMEKTFFWACVYAMIHAREPDAFDGDMQEEDKAYLRIRDMGIHLAATEEELVKALDCMLGLAKEKPKAHKQAEVKEQVNWGNLVRRLETQSGIKADVWLWEKSLSYCIKAYQDIGMFARAYSGTSGRPAKRMQDELDLAIINLAQVMGGIVSRIEAERAEAAKAKETDDGSAEPVD